MTWADTVKPGPRYLAAVARRAKTQRRFLAYLSAVWGYHPLHQRQAIMPEWWFALVVDPADDDGPVGECYCATTRPPCGVCEPSR